MFVLHARTQARTDESMHLTGVRRSAEWHSGTQALEVQESARARRNRYQRLSKYWAENNLDGGVVPVGHKVYIGSCISLWAAR